MQSTTINIYGYFFTGLTKKYVEKYRCVVVRMGGFHIAENFLAAIGFYMQGGGIEDILVKSGICGQGTANKVVGGRDYYKMVRYYSLICEAMLHLKWNAFHQWLDFRNQSDSLLDLDMHLNELLHLIETANKPQIETKIVQIKEDLLLLQPLWIAFEDTLGPTAKYWSMFIDMVQVLKRYIRAERSGNWKEHLVEVQNMIPFLVSARHVKYANCLPEYLHDMQQLEETHPEVYLHFSNGNFPVYQSQSSFCGTWTDLTLEQTYNKEGKTSLFKGISQNESAREKYIKAAPLLTKVSEAVKDMAHISSASSGHHGSSQKQIQEDRNVIEKIKLIISTTMIDPFLAANQADLINIFTGVRNTSDDLIYAQVKGISAMKAAEEAESGKILCPQIKRFTEKSSIHPNKDIMIRKVYQEESSMTRTLCFIQNADGKTRSESFSFEWTNYPSSIFQPAPHLPSGYSMLKGNKCDFLASLLSENNLFQPHILPVSELPTVFIIDAMSFIHRYQHMGAKTFGDLPKRYIAKMLDLKPNCCTEIHFIGDRYDIDCTRSIKNDERILRCKSAKFVPEYVPKGNLEIPEWKALMQNCKSKANLLAFLSDTFCKERASMIPKDINIILGGTFVDQAKAVALTKNDESIIEQLSCKEHEEADTRIFAHAGYFSSQNQQSRIVIHATDTDIIILSMYHISRMTSVKEIWIQKYDTYLPVHQLLETLSEKYSKETKVLSGALMNGYVLTGCDSVSYIYRRGKRKAAKLALQKADDFTNMTAYGQGTHNLEVTENLIEEARKFIVSLYVVEQFSNLNLLREHLFVHSRSDLRTLPPTEDAFYQHVLRVLYQLIVYKNAVKSELNLPPATDYGRKIIDGKLQPVMMTKPAKPTAIKTVSCKCKVSKCSRNCLCARANVPCFVGCTCLGNPDKCSRVPDNDLSGEENDD